MANVHAADPGFRLVLCLNPAKRGGGRGTAPFRGVGVEVIRYAGGRTVNHIHITMEDNTISQQQRDSFVRLLNEAKQRRQQDFEERMQEKVRFEFLPKLVQQQGITSNVERITKLATDLAESARALQTAESVEKKDEGFFSRLVKPHDMRELLARMIRPYQENEQKVMRDYDVAALKVMSADTVEDARKIVESLI